MNAASYQLAGFLKSSLRDMAPKLIIRDISFSERLVRFRMPFRFGAVTVEEAPQVFVAASIEVEGHGRALGASAELMVPKWFDKDPKLTPAETVNELRRSLDITRELYFADNRRDTAFGLHAAVIGPQIPACERQGIPPLAANFGPAEIDKAILDALLRALNVDFFTGVKRNICGLDARLTPDLDREEIEHFLAERKPLHRIAVRHTVGLGDSVGSLEAVIRETGCRYFKIKLCGEPVADRARLVEIASLFAKLNLNYRATVDGNEQYFERKSLAALVAALSDDSDLQPFAGRLLYIEQPFPREATWNEPLGALGDRFAFIIDEADGSYDAFPKARALGYRGVSSKCCKGLYKALLNGARAEKWNRAEGLQTFIAAEDLTCQAGLAVQQDTTLAAFLGIWHAERNGHHYVDGFADAPVAEARAFLAAHPDLYEDSGGRIRLAIRDGNLSIDSLAVPGFASGVDPMLALPSSAKSSFKEPKT
jgi:hypothetical protein